MLFPRFSATQDVAATGAGASSSSPSSSSPAPVSALASAGHPNGSGFAPTSLGLRPDFRLTDFSKLKG